VLLEERRFVTGEDMRSLLVFAVVLLVGCQAKPAMPPLPEWRSAEGLDHAELGLIIDLRSGARLTPSQLLDELAGSGRVLVGERHDNPDHHGLQLWLMQAMQQRRAQGSVLLEMLNPDQQERVTRVQASTRIGHGPQDLPQALGWQKGWEWSQYGALVEYALAQPYPLLHANLDRSEITAIYRNPPTVEEAAGAAAVQEVLLDQIRTSHCRMLPEAQLPAMLAIQQQRDRRMAFQLDAAPKPALLLAGAFHVRRDLGVPLHALAPDTLRVLMLAEVGERYTAEQADFVWYTPAQSRQDHCAAWGKR